ncbi:hypothetical protein [Microbulbifer sp. VVAC002]|uniref:hypothetical protein n=1 Tax=Microbulbifer sp. VVAC002 TaxID=3243387 RepID=UPI00403987F7
MTKIVSRSINREVSFTVLVEDNSPILFQTKVKKSLENWLDEAQTILKRAIDMCTVAITYPDKVPDKFKNLVSYYFGLPMDCPPQRYSNCVNAILQKLSKTQIGLSGDVECADVKMMPTLCKVQCSTISTIGYPFGIEDPSKNAAGFVFVPFTESWGRSISNFCKLSWAGGGQLKGGSFIKPNQNPICLSFSKIWEKGEVFCIVTLIHEGTHKYAQTVDHKYFNDEGIADKLDKAISEGGAIWMKFHQDSGKTHDQAFKLVVQQAFNQLRGQDAAATLMAELTEVKAVENADSVAWFAYDVAQLPSEQEVGRVITGMVGKRKVHPSLLNH